MTEKRLNILLVAVAMAFLMGILILIAAKAQVT